MAMYLIRDNFKAAQPLLKEQYGISTTELGQIGLTFSIIYGIGKIVMGYLIAGKNTKKIISCLQERKVRVIEKAKVEHAKN